MKPPLSIGDEVLIIGPAANGDKTHFGEKFRITEHWSGKEEEYSNVNLPWYPASSLQLVEKLKIGDWVKIAGPDCMDIMRSHDPEKAYKIFTKTDSGNFQIWGIGFFPSSSLRKLTPEETPRHTKPKPLELSEETKEKIRKLLEKTVSETIDEMSDTNERLSVIEKRQSLHQNRLDRLAGEMLASQTARKSMQKSIDVLMGEMPEVIDCQKPNRVICPNARFAPKNKCMFCGDGHALCHDNLVRGECPVLDSMREG